ncbi:hypothetical protein V1517DRAFT_348431 [Lipomyces orientalis]|uniref:Uncharacterized protein n=1 Tax=Lipomyces orientalis TaxID=1233043 RepID=A0ACC3TGR6_9ASCO
MKINISNILLSALLVFGGGALHGFSTTNGLYTLVNRLVDKRELPDRNLSLTYEKTFTSYAAVDNLLRGLITFFWPIANGSHAGLSLLSFLFAGQTVASWTLTMLEGIRKGNRGYLISFTTVYGILIQTMGFALAGPLYLLIHLSTSPTVTSKSSGIAIDESDLRALPLSVVTGFILPSMLMSLNASSTFNTHGKVVTILLWQFFPVWCAFALWVWKAVLDSLHMASSYSWSSATPRTHLRLVYIVTLSIAALAYIATMALSISAYLFPGLFAPESSDLIMFGHLFVPASPFSATQAPSVAQGAYWFMQWDFIVSSIAYIIWAFTLRTAAIKQHSGSELSWVGALLQILLRTILLGPMAAALTFVWERDEIVLSNETSDGQKKF